MLLWRKWCAILSCWCSLVLGTFRELDLFTWAFEHCRSSNRNTVDCPNPGTRSVTDNHSVCSVCFTNVFFHQIKFGKVGAGENNTSVSELDYHCCKHMPIAFSYHNNCQIFHYGLCVFWVGQYFTANVVQEIGQNKAAHVKVLPKNRVY